MEVDLDLTPAALAMCGQAVDEALVVLLSRVEVGVAEGSAIDVTPGLDRSWILPAPSLDPPLLFVRSRAGTGRAGDK